MPSVDTVVIGAGQAGLATSCWLTDLGVDHVVLERGRVAERWRSERWDSLRLLTPNWMSRLPSWSYTGPDPNGFMTAAEVAAHLDAYRQASSSPVVERTEVRRVGEGPCGLEVDTDDQRWWCRNVVLATGWCDVPWRPVAAAKVSRDVLQLAPSEYRNPDQLPAGGVLVVGASASGVQLADELADAGRDVVLAAGSHTRVPRTYRGMDVFWWLDRMGNLDRDIDDMADLRVAQHEPSLQLVGRPDRRSVDFAALRAKGVAFAGRLLDADGDRVGFAPNLDASVADAERRLARLLDRIDAHVAASGLADEVLAPDRPAPVGPVAPLDGIHLRTRGIRTVLWATGYRRRYPWLQLPVLDRRGELVQRRGVTSHPGLYAVGLRFQQTRRSTFIDGVGADARHVVEHLVARTAQLRR
jgi:putative flavoprotein involved in K+ transport